MSTHRKPPEDEIQPIVMIYNHADDPYLIVVKYVGAEGLEVEPVEVNTSPDPTWPSPSELNDMLADATRTVMDRAWAALTGEQVDR